jgi:hypothetical protein
MLRARIDKTREKIPDGRLPLVPDPKPVIETGDDNLCSGCGEPIRPIEQLYRPRVASLRLHDVCYYIWTASVPSGRD